jgi:hypothetical protein
LGKRTQWQQVDAAAAEHNHPCDRKQQSRLLYSTAGVRKKIISVYTRARLLPTPLGGGGNN